MSFVMLCGFFRGLRWQLHPWGRYH